MVEPPSSKKSQPPLVDNILQCGKQAFDPELPLQSRNANMSKFVELMESTKILALIPVLNLLIQPGRTQPWLRAPLISILARLPLRPQGVHHTIEFVLSVHPSSTSRNESAGPGRGANITHEALNAASRLISSPPVGMAPEDWFNGISPQLLSLLDGDGEPEMDRAAAFIIGFGILGKKQFGAPGSPGWKAFVNPILASIDFSLAESSGNQDADPIITLGAPKVLVTSQDVARSLKRLSVLVTSHPHPALTKRILSPILLPLWSLSYWPHGSEHTENLYRKPARILLKTLIQLLPSNKPSSEKTGQTSDALSIILRNLTFSGRPMHDEVSWAYSTTKIGDIQVQEVIHAKPGVPDFVKIDNAVDSFITLLQGLPDMRTEISSLFVELCTRWLASSTLSQPSIITRLETLDSSDIETRLIEAKVMGKMMTEFPDKLISDSRQVLSLVDQVLSGFVSGVEGNEDTVAVALSLLNIVLTSPSFRASEDTDSRWNSIKHSLHAVGKRQLDVSSTANNLLLVLRFGHTMDEPNIAPQSTSTIQQIEDRKSYSLAMSYLTAADSPPPVRAQGLELISRLVKTNSTVLDIPALLVLFSSLLQDSEEYIYLRAIQSLIQLSQRHPKTVMQDLVDRYVDPNEESELDQRLRIGEALLQVVQSNYLAFTGELSRSVCEGLLFIAGRRGYRPKTERSQENKNKLKRKKDSEAEEAWGGPVPELDEVLESESPEDHEVISQIISGWESKRGSEDVRIRASALSILGSGIEAYISGVGSRIISAAVDLSVHILTLEPEAEKGILRRASILLIMSFIEALSQAREAGQKLPFGFVGQSLDDVQRILEYIVRTDNDGLVQQHARDVVESLVAWQMESLLPVKGREQRLDTGLQELAGLRVSPGGQQTGAGGSSMPRIEEIE